MWRCPENQRDVSTYAERSHPPPPRSVTKTRRRDGLVVGGGGHVDDAGAEDPLREGRGPWIRALSANRVSGLDHDVEALLAPAGGPVAEGQETRRHEARHGARELEGVSLGSAEDAARGSEGRGHDVEDLDAHGGDSCAAWTSGRGAGWERGTVRGRCCQMTPICMSMSAVCGIDMSVPVPMNAEVHMSAM